MTFLLCCGMLVFIAFAKIAQLERRSFDNAVAYAIVIAALISLAIAARWSASKLARSPEGVLQFEEAAEPAIFALDLHRDGVTPIATSLTQGDIE